jgi:hypothetical protein
MKRATVKLTLALSLLAGALFTAVPSQADPECKKNKDVVCPAIFDPVICQNNKVYSNACFAAADCAKNCVPFTPEA